MPRPFDLIRKLIGPIASPVYAAVVARRNRGFDRGVGVRAVPVPVVSIGNLSTGGTGKTPLVMWLVRSLASRGVGCGIAMRGYKAAAGSVGDEAEIYQRLLGGVPVVAQPDRFAGITRLLGSPQGKGVACIVLDDGFQHRRLARKVDIVVLDASADPFVDTLLPGGDLREPVSSLTRAHAVVVTHAELVGASVVESILVRARQVNPRLIGAVCRHAWTGLRVVHAGQERTESIDWLAGRRVLAVCGIGRPRAFFEQLRTTGAVIAEHPLPDHDAFAPATIERIKSAAAAHGAEVVVCTEKDWSKLRTRADELGPWPLAVTQLEIVFLQGEAELLTFVLGAIGWKDGSGAGRP